MARPRRSSRKRNRPFRFEQLEPKLALASVALTQAEAAAPAPLLPKIEVSHFGQDISFVTASGPVRSITLTAGGSGYTTAPTVTINANGAGSGATAEAVLGTGADAGKVVGITVTNAGSGYTGTASVTLAGGGGSGAEASLIVDLSNRQMFQAWADDYIAFITNSGASVAYINIGDYSNDNKHAYDYLRPELGDDGVPWIVPDFLDKLPADVAAGAIAYLDIANPWTLYDSNNTAGNVATTDGRAGSPPRNNAYQAFQLVNEINANQARTGGAKFITHFQADGEGAGAFEGDSYYGFGQTPIQGTPYDPAGNRIVPDPGWKTPADWPAAGYGYLKWLWNKFMPGVTASDVAPGGTPLPAGGNVPDVVFTDAEAVDPATWSNGTASPYRFGIIKYAQTSWLKYSPGPMIAYTENYWFGENHYMPGPGSAIAPDARETINYVSTPVLDPPATGNDFDATPLVTFNQPVDAQGQKIGTPAMGYAVMGTGSIDDAALTSGLAAFFGNGVGNGYSTGVWIGQGQGGSGYSVGSKDSPNVTFSPRAGDAFTRSPIGYIDTVDATTGAIMSITILDPGAGYTQEPIINLPQTTGTVATPQVYLLPEHGYPRVSFPQSPTGAADSATGFVTVNPQSSGKPGQIQTLKVLDWGSGYARAPNTSVQFAPITTFTTPDGGIPGPLTIIDHGSGYTAPPNISIYKPPGGVGPTLQVAMDGDSVGSVQVTNSGSGYSAENPPTIIVAPAQPEGFDSTPHGPLAGPGGLPVQFITSGFSPVRSDYPSGWNNVTKQAPTLHAPVNASARQIVRIVITVLGDHYDTATNKPYYTLSGDSSQTRHYLTGGVDKNGVDPDYNAAYVPALDRSGGFPVDPTGRGSISIIDSGFGYSAGAVVQTAGAGYDNKKIYDVTFPAPSGGGTAAQGILLVNSDGAVTGVVVTSPGAGYAAADDGLPFTLPTPEGGTAATAKAYLSHYPSVTITASAQTGPHTPAHPYVITGPTDPKHPTDSDPSTGYIVTGIGFTYPGVGYAPDTNFSFAFSPPANVTGSKPAVAQALPALASKYSAASLPALGQIANLPTDTIHGGANAYNWQISNGFGPGQVADITNLVGGSGYVAATPPAVTFSPPPAGGRQATGHAVVTGGAVTSIMIDDPGYGYGASQSVTVTIAPPTATGTQATARVVLGDVQIMSTAALQTVYAHYAARPDLLAAMFNDPLYQDVPLPKLSEEFYWPLGWGDFTNPDSTDGTKVPQNAIATFSIESLNRSNTFDAEGNYVPGTTPGWTATRTALDSKYQSEANLRVPNTLGGTFSGLSSLTYAQFVDFLNSAATIIADNGPKQPDGSPVMSPQDVTFQVYDAAFLPLEWISQANPNRWAAENAAPVFVSATRGSVVENTSTSTPIYVANASDVGTTWEERTVTYDLKPGVGDAAAVSIDRRSGAVRLLTPANYEAKRSYRFVVTATDGGAPALVSEHSVTISVEDVFEPPAAPTITVPAAFDVVEDTRTPLVFLEPPLADADTSPTKRVSVTLAVQEGSLVAARGPGVTVGGTARARTLRGSLAAINAYLTSARQPLAYRPAAEATQDQTLSIRVRESSRGVRLVSTAESTLRISAVNDAPRVRAPATFRVMEGAVGRLTWPLALTPVEDVDSDTITLTLAVSAGVLDAAEAAGVTVGGTATALTLSGSPADLNALLRRPDGISYTPPLGNGALQMLTLAADDGILRAETTSRIVVRAVNDAPLVEENGLVLGAVEGRAFRIDATMLRDATGARDADSGRLSFQIDTVTSGTVQRRRGGRWVTVSEGSPLASRLVTNRRPLRWIAPADALGTTAAFTVRAWDGRLASATVSQVSVSIAATADTSFAYFIGETSQVPNVPAGYGVIGEFDAAGRAAVAATGRIVGESVALKNQEKNNPVGYSLWPLISDLFASRDTIQPGDRMALAEQILTNVLVNPGLSATSEFPSPHEGTPANPGDGYVIWAQDFEFTPGVVSTMDVYAGVTAVLWAGRTYLGESFKIMPVPSSSLFKTLGDITGKGMGDYVADAIINGTETTPYLASLGLRGLPPNAQEGSNGQWNFLSLLYANGLIDGFFGQNYNATQVGIVTSDTLPFHDTSLPYAIQSAHDDPSQVATGGPWHTVYNGAIPFHATVYWAGDVDPAWGQPPKKPVLLPTQAPLPARVFAAYGRSRATASA